MTTRDVLEVDGLTRRYGSTTVLHDLHVRLGTGRRLGLAGPNGSGKTTLLRCIAGSLTPSEGAVRVAGSRAGSLAARAVTGVTVGGEKAFYLRLTGRANLRFYASLRVGGSAARRAADAVVEELEIDFADVRVDKYSSGMAQQLAFARSLLGDPRLLLLDEPTRSLDEGATARLWAALHRRPDAAVVIATHRRDDLERCDERLDLS